MSLKTIDVDLIRKFNVPGPRYTSYAPATHFTEETSRDQLIEKIIANNQTADRDLSLYFYLPFCQSLCWYCGLYYGHYDQAGQELPVSRLRGARARLDGRIHSSGSKGAQLHLGGGTPTFLLLEEIQWLVEMVKSRFKIDPDIEASVEIDPRSLTEGKLAALSEAGFTCASIGVQDNNPEVQQAVYRIQPLEMTQKVVKWIREAGFQSLNIDLIYGLPHQTVETFEKTINEFLELDLNRLAVFSYAHVPWIKPAQKILKEEFLPTPEVNLELLKLTVEKLTGVGFINIGMDHFARPDDELAVAQRAKTLQRNFQGYSTKGGTDIYSFGMSEMLGIDFKEHFASEIASLDDLEEGGLLQRFEDRIEVTELGQMFIHIVAMRFDEYLMVGRKEQCSKAI